MDSLESEINKMAAEEIRRQTNEIRILRERIREALVFCKRRSGHKLMQVAQPFRELINILNPPV